MKDNHPSSVSDNKTEDKLGKKVSPDELSDTQWKDLPATIGIFCEVLNAVEFVKCALAPFLGNA